jgi:hypothetical protein
MDAKTNPTHWHECRFCGVNLAKLPAEANIFPHRIGLCIPSRHEIEATIQALEIEDEREQEALRRFYEREAGENMIRKTWRWLKDRWHWIRWFSWQ